MSIYAKEQWDDLIDQTKSLTPKELGDQVWYILIAAALATSPSPQLLAEFYTYLTQHNVAFTHEDAKQKLSLQFRDLLLKQVTLNGAPQVLMAMTPLAAAEGTPQGKAKDSQLSEKWNTIDRDAIHARGLDTIHSIYGHELLHNRIFPQWGYHTADVQFMELFTVYGLYLSDFEQFTPLETELIVFVTISCLGLGTGPALWHLRGLGRLLGARGMDDKSESVRKVKDLLRNIKVAMMGVVEFVGEAFLVKAKLDTWPNVGDVVRVLDGWGEDA
ncbi:hypothetical protein LTR64_001704 [Lithohypha guttulata]|uniref:uncharacterized protein n=1 Tax=Lithohypha guttulata TaxID=1690604 RepID=UPI00315DA2A6